MADQQTKKNKLGALLERYLSLPKNTPDPHLVAELKKQAEKGGMQDALAPAILAFFGLGTSAGLPGALRAASVLEAVNSPEKDPDMLEGVVPTPIKAARKTMSLLPRLRQTVETQTRIDPLQLLHEKISGKPTDFHRTWPESAAQILTSGKIKPTNADGDFFRGVATSRVPSIGPKSGSINLGIQTDTPRRPFQASGFEKFSYAGSPFTDWEFENRTKRLPIPAKDIRKVYVQGREGNEIALREAVNRGIPVEFVREKTSVRNEDPMRLVNASPSKMTPEDLKFLIENTGKPSIVSQENYYDKKYGISRPVFQPKSGITTQKEKPVDQKLQEILDKTTTKSFADQIKEHEELMKKTGLKTFADYEGFDSFSDKINFLKEKVGNTKKFYKEKGWKLGTSEQALDDLLKQVDDNWGLLNVDLTPMEWTFANSIVKFYKDIHKDKK